MRSEASSSSSSGIGVVGLLGVVFVTLKLIGRISWSWWWVTAPFWGGLAVLLTIFIGAFVAIWIGQVLRIRKRRKQLGVSK